MDWKRLLPVRTALLSVSGFGFLVVAAFLFSVVLGFAALGIACLLLEFLTRPGEA